MKQHEILAIEGTKEKVAKKLMKESLVTLKKDSLFKGQTRVLEMFKDEDKHLETTEHQELTSTVDENLDYLVDPIADWLDVVLIKERGNQVANADLEVDGQVLIKAVPATFLLGLEKKLIELRLVYEAIPTLAPGIKWIPDTQDRKGVFISNDEVVSFKTKKDLEFKVAYEATKEHPAQIAQVQTEINIGKYRTSVKSGMMTPFEKATRLDRIDKLLAATKKARMRANNIDVANEHHCKALLDFINS